MLTALEAGQIYRPSSLPQERNGSTTIITIIASTTRLNNCQNANERLLTPPHGPLGATRGQMGLSWPHTLIES